MSEGLPVLTLKRKSKASQEENAAPVVSRRKTMIVVPPSQPRKRKVVQPPEPATAPPVKEAKPAPATPPAEVKPTKKKPKKQRANRHPRLIPVEEALLLMSEFWPGLIFDGQCRQLKIGIKSEMKADIEQRELALSKKKMGSVLMTITHSEAYRQASVAGAVRYDSAGHPAGEVTAEDAYNIG